MKRLISFLCFMPSLVAAFLSFFYVATGVDMLSENRWVVLLSLAAIFAVLGVGVNTEWK